MELFNHSSEPTSLHHGLSGWPPAGPNNFRWQQGRLVYSLVLGRRSWEKVVVPTQSHWQELWTVCNEIDVWSWPRTLGDMEWCDGLQWVVELEIGSRRVASSGQVHGSPPGFRERLMRLHGQLQAMVGWRELNNKDDPWSPLSGAFMEREVFILSSGESFSAWEVQVGYAQSHVETQQKYDGNSSRTWKFHFETMEVKFRACPGSLAVGQKGQLSSIVDEFFDVTISAIAPAGDYDLITGRTFREIGSEVGAPPWNQAEG